MKFSTGILGNRFGNRECSLDVSGSKGLRDSLDVNTLVVHGCEEVGSSAWRQIDDKDLVAFLEEKGGPA